jgi:hypothetical protein
MKLTVTTAALILISTYAIAQETTSPQLNPDKILTMTVKDFQTAQEAARLNGLNQGRNEAAHMLQIDQAAQKVFADLNDQTKIDNKSNEKTDTEKK